MWLFKSHLWVGFTFLEYIYGWECHFWKHSFMGVGICDCLKHIYGLVCLLEHIYGWVWLGVGRCDSVCVSVGGCEWVWVDAVGCGWV